MRAKGAAREKHRGEQDDQERPQVVDEVGLDGRRVPESGEVQEVVSEEAADTDEIVLRGTRHERARTAPTVPLIHKAMPTTKNGGTWLRRAPR